MARNYMKYEKKQDIKERISIILWFLFSFVIALIIAVALDFVTVSGSSMEPTLEAGDYLLTTDLLMFVDPPEFGDLVVFNCDLVSDEGYKRMIRRVVGTPGDKVSISGGKLYLNGIAVDDENIEGIGESEYMKPIIVDENEVFVLADRQEQSFDSRSSEIGLIQYEDIIGIVEYRLFPFNRIGKVK